MQINPKQSNRARFFLISFGFLTFLLLLSVGFFKPAVANVQKSVTVPTPLPSPAVGTVRVAAIGDFGSGSVQEGDVAALVHSWNPNFIITLGDNNYPSGAANTIDSNIGQFYHDFIAPYGGIYGAGAASNKFFPVLGNHDWMTSNAQPYQNYFALPNNERYYDFTAGPIHFFAVDSDSHEPDGITSTSTQAQWLHTALSASPAPWKLVYFHHAPYSSSSSHGSNPTLQWPFAAWGATAVLAGHDHTYERVLRDGIVYFVNGLGGYSIYNFGAPISGSAARYNGDYGAMLIEASATQISFQFITRGGTLIDSYAISIPACCDLNSSGSVDIADVLLVAAAWQTQNPLFDFDLDGFVDADDLVKVASSWQQN